MQKELDDLGFDDAFVDWVWQTHARVWRMLDEEVWTLERLVANELREHPGFQALQTVTGIGPPGDDDRPGNRRHRPIPEGAELCFVLPLRTRQAVQ